MKRPILFIVTAFLGLVVFCWCCKDPAEKEAAAVTNFEPVPLPDPGIPGYHFPEDSNVIKGWIKAGDTTSMYKHSWGVWTALTSPSGVKIGSDELDVYETWNTPQEVYFQMFNTGNLKAAQTERPRTSLEVPRQFTHHLPMSERKLLQQENDSSQNVLVTMKYDPTAAKHVRDDKLLDSNVLNTMLKQGVKSVPEFPNTSVALKPTYEVIKVKELQNGLYTMKVWTGPPNPDTIAYPNKSWPACVYVDINGKGKGNGAVDSTLHTPTPYNTYNLSDFIHFKIDKKTAELINKEGLQGGVSEGDYVILVCMHISTKEIREWVWQSMWWAPNADAPPLPSYGTIAAQRPAQLKGAARHYAMTTAYYTITPPQPYAGGKNVGAPLYAYNPYLEANFGPSVFGGGPVPSVITNPKGGEIRNYAGVRTNCMACHGVATYASAGNSLNYVGDRYIDMDAAFFKKYVQVDFLWSIQGVASAPPKSLAASSGATP